MPWGSVDACADVPGGRASRNARGDRQPQLRAVAPPTRRAAPERSGRVDLSLAHRFCARLQRPLGKGFADAIDRGKNDIAVCPTRVRPGSITTERETPSAGFGPIPLTWPQAFESGTYTRSGRRTLGRSTPMTATELFMLPPRTSVEGLIRGDEDCSSRICIRAGPYPPSFPPSRALLHGRAGADDERSRGSVGSTRSGRHGTESSSCWLRNRTWRPEVSFLYQLSSPRSRSPRSRGRATIPQRSGMRSIAAGRLEALRAEPGGAGTQPQAGEMPKSTSGPECFRGGRLRSGAEGLRQA